MVSVDESTELWRRPPSPMLNMGQTRPLFDLFSFFSHNKYSTNTINDKSIDGVLGTQTGSSRMVGADESTELWWHPLPNAASEIMIIILVETSTALKAEVRVIEFESHQIQFRSSSDLNRLYSANS